ncbi:unnamed protein product, partial [Prorocentrum cordatum]
MAQPTVQEWAWVQYARAAMFHQRLVLGVLAGFPTEAHDVLVAAPDSDVYCETHGGTDPNVAAARWSESRRPPPLGVLRGSYGCRREPTPADLQEFQRLARIAARDEHDLGWSLPEALCCRRWPIQGAHRTPRRVSPARETERLERWEVERLWVLGAALPLGALPRAQRARAELRPRRRLAPVPSREVESHVRRETIADARIMPIELVVEQGVVTPFQDWLAQGPRTAEWAMWFLDRRGGGPGHHHAWWRQVNRLQRGDWGVEVYENGPRALEVAASYDALEVANCACLEIIAREWHLPAGGHAAPDEKDGKDKKNRGKGRWRGGLLDESDSFMGRHRETRERMASPDLLDVVAREVERDASAMKQ